MTLQDNETLDPVRTPTNRDVISGKWVYRLKLVHSSQVQKYKVLYVASFCQQQEKLEIFETFCAYMYARDFQNSTPTFHGASYDA